MHKVLCIAAGFALLAGPVLAQTDERPRTPDPRDRSYEDRGTMRGDREDRRDYGRDRYGMRDDDDDDDRHERMYRGGRHGGYHGRGASFMLRSGDTRLAVRCGPDESMRACVDAALTLLDRARQAPPTPTPRTSLDGSDANRL